jgi:hypothetical protein
MCLESLVLWSKSSGYKYEQPLAPLCKLLQTCLKMSIPPPIVDNLLNYTLLERRIQKEGFKWQFYFSLINNNFLFIDAKRAAKRYFASNSSSISNKIKSNRIISFFFFCFAFCLMTEKLSRITYQDSYHFSEVSFSNLHSKYGWIIDIFQDDWFKLHA